MKYTCWICYDECSNKLRCNCNNAFSYCHIQCLNKWCIESKNNYCKFCSMKYRIPLYFKIYIYICKLIKEIYYFLDDISKYNLYTGEPWIEEDE